MGKHKQPKNDKHKARKDLKDYTIDKEVEGMVPNASGEPLPEVPRKDDKEVIDDVENMVPKVKDSDRVYVTKDMEDGDSKMPSKALKQLVKHQEEDAKELIDTLSKKDGGYMTQIEKLTKEQKEQLVKEIVKRKVVKFLDEQALNTIKIEQEDETKPEEKPEEKPKDIETTDTETPELPDTEPADTEAPAPIDTETPAPIDTETPAPTDTETPAEKDSEISSPEDLDQSDADPRVDNFIKSLEQKEGMLQQVKLLMKVVKSITNDKDEKSKIGFLGLLKRVIDKSLKDK